MRLAALYTVFNGLELLEGSISQIISEVDLVVISFQEVSNRGKKSEEVRSFVRRFERNPKINVIEFIPDLKKDTKQNERDKHFEMIRHASIKGCTHFFLSACDHYYQKSDFKRAKRIYLQNPVDVSLTAMFTYYKRPEWQISPIEEYFMPFICKIHPETVVTQSAVYPVRVDPSVRISPANTFKVFDQSEIMLHHYSMIRVNIEDKFRNAASRFATDEAKIQQHISEYERAKVGDSITYFQGRKLIEVENYFGI